MILQEHVGAFDLGGGEGDVASLEREIRGHREKATGAQRVPGIDILIVGKRKNWNKKVPVGAVSFHSDFSCNKQCVFCFKNAKKNKDSLKLFCRKQNQKIKKWSQGCLQSL